jgi:hypothetical protein
MRERDRFGRSRCKLVDNIKIDFQEVGYGGMDWIELACECGNETPGKIK